MIHIYLFVTISRCMSRCITWIANNFKILTWILVLIKIWILVSILIVTDVIIWSLIRIRILIEIHALIIIFSLIEIWIWIIVYVKIRILIKISTCIILIRIAKHILIISIENWAWVESTSSGKIRVGWETIYISMVVSIPMLI